MQTYVRPNLVFTHGEGARMYDAAGKEYLDFAAGIAVNALGAPHRTYVLSKDLPWQAQALCSLQRILSRHCTRLGLLAGSNHTQLPA